ncbi:hypothetical protein ABLN64_08900, partial [Mycobacterium tuberculosis]
MAGLNIYVRRWRTALHATVSALIVAILGYYLDAGTGDGQG